MGIWMFHYSRWYSEMLALKLESLYLVMMQEGRASHFWLDRFAASRTVDDSFHLHGFQSFRAFIFEFSFRTSYLAAEVLRLFLLCLKHLNFCLLTHRIRMLLQTLRILVTKNFTEVKVSYLQRIICSITLLTYVLIQQIFSQSVTLWNFQLLLPCSFVKSHPNASCNFSRFSFD